MNKMLAYYTQQSVITDPGEYAHMYADLPSDIPALCTVTQNMLLHIFWIPAYGVELSEERKKEVNIRTVAGMLARIVELDDQPVTVPRTPEQRLVGNCRDFTVFLCSMLRHKGIPARARCGFARYFTPGKYEDHWVCEYWNVDEKKWVQVDAQLDSIQIKTLKIDFNPCDVPGDKFLNGGKAWKGCRAGDIDPELCGIFEMKGLWFVQGDLVRDFMALNRVEVLPWDCNELMPGPDQQVSEANYELLDNVAYLATAGNKSFAELRALYDSTAALHMPADWKP
ncbi:hypothetical protein AMJ87_11980 [candidate division WOR_3 bacterium SM23_60]|uniref:Transglutaminase-like domain-containing protein n=1 Tax=candidate division WOR_3 bacterium SM23_60 TaxID=1703780 RepID=A0A0S8G5V9_UNCW3|nr:MAG: hypothetical protein AMJ87_11980 [candidate division WOR_3 bacterium SM23_60]